MSTEKEMDEPGKITTHKSALERLASNPPKVDPSSLELSVQLADAREDVKLYEARARRAEKRHDAMKLDLDVALDIVAKTVKSFQPDSAEYGAAKVLLSKHGRPFGG
jgi:hypothetical protein